MTTELTTQQIIDLINQQCNSYNNMMKLMHKTDKIELHIKDNSMRIAHNNQTAILFYWHDTPQQEALEMNAKRMLQQIFFLGFDNTIKSLKEL